VEPDAHLVYSTDRGYVSYTGSLLEITVCVNDTMRRFLIELPLYMSPRLHVHCLGAQQNTLFAIQNQTSISKKNFTRATKENRHLTSRHVNDATFIKVCNLYAPK